MLGSKVRPSLLDLQGPLELLLGVKRYSNHYRGIEIKTKKI